MNRIRVYFMPGMAANAFIFERIKLDATLFEVFYLEWKIPKEKETLEEYAKRIALDVKEENPVLIGVSFGGILVQEMAKYIAARKVIIISSVKTNQEFPKRIKFAKSTSIYSLIPVRSMLGLGKLAQSVFGKKANQKIQLYEKFLSVREVYYLKWAVKNVVLWNCSVADENVIHIHGDKDSMFPIKNIKNCIVLKGGTHVMIFTKYRWFNAYLPAIILGENEK